MQRKNGFTLVELVVVVMILGILAAVAAPKLLGTSSAATDNGLKQTLAVVRDAIERYAAEHGGTLPGQAGTDAGMTADLTPYLRGTFPKCPLSGGNNLIKFYTTDNAPITGEAATPAKSWHYSTKSGQFICNHNGATKSDPTVNYDVL